MPKVNLSPSDILYICVSTAQNTINLFPIAECLNLINTKFKNGKIYTCILSSNAAESNKNNWTSRLEKLLPNSNKILIDEKNTLKSNSITLLDKISAQYKIEPLSNIIINYGGGTKPIIAFLWDFIKYLDGNITMVYPDKGQNKMYWLEFDRNKISKEIQQSNEVKLPLISKYNIAQVLSLFTDNILELKYLIENGHKTKFGDTIIQLPDLYSDDNLKDLLYHSTSNKNIKDFGSLTVNQFFDLLKEKEFKKNAIKKIAMKINSENYEFVLNEDDFSLSPKYENIKDLKLISTQIKKWIWQIGFYSQDNYILIKDETIALLLSYNLNAPPLINENKYFINRDGFHHIFKDSIFTDIRSHGSYFEYYCFKIFLSLFDKFKNAIIDILYNFKDFNQSQNISEIDIVLFTKSGSIYFFEMKTYDFNSKDYLAANFKVNELGGIFNNYYIVVPPLPSNEDLKKEATTYFTKMYSNITARKLITCCQINSSNGIVENFKDIEVIFNEIISKENIE